MKKTLFILTAMLLFMGAVIAQPRMSAPNADISKATNLISASVVQTPATKNRDVVYSEGFEGTSGGGGALPSGWTATTSGKWLSYNNLSEVPQCGDNFSPHGGSKMMGNSWYNSVNCWAFSPGFNLVGGTPYNITFWYNAMGYEPYDEPDDFEVKIGTAPNASSMSELVFSQTGLYYNFDFIWRTTTKTFTPATSGTYYLGFHDTRSANTGLALLIDDIEVSGGGTVDPCPAVTNVTATQFEANKVIVNWTAPAGKALTEYKVYNGTTVAATVPAETTTWTSGALASGTYTFSVEAIFDDECIPVKVAAAPIEIKTCNGVVSNLVVDYAADCSKATLTWDAPAKGRDYLGWMKWCVNDEVTGRVGWDTYVGNDMTACLRFLPADLANLGIVSGQKINKVALGLGTGLSYINTMEIRIWEGGTSVTDPGTLKYTFPLTGPWGSYTENAMAEFEIAPYTIDATKELRIGWNLVNTADYPFGRDAGPTVSGKGMVFYCETSPVNGWVDAAAKYGWNYNWSIKAFVDEGGVLETKYNVYRDGAPIASAIEETTYVNEGFDPTQAHTWSVAVVCSNGGDGEWTSVTDAEPCDNTPEPCNPVTSVKVDIEVNCTAATLSWAPITGATGYKVKGEGPEVTVTEPTYTETADFEDGKTYTWKITTVCAGGEADAFEVSEEASCVGITEFEKTISIYPNPAYKTVTIVAEKFTKVEVYSSIGQLMVTQKDATVDVSNYQAGIYFFKIFDNNNNTAMKRISVIK